MRPGSSLGRTGDIRFSSVRWIGLLAVLAALGTQNAAGAQPPAVGNQRVLVVLATWGPQPFTREDVASAFADAARFYDKSSFHQLSLSADVTPWLPAFTA